MGPSALLKRNLFIQGNREGTSSVGFEVLIRNCKINLINLFIFNYLFSLKYKFVYPQPFDVKTLFSKKHVFRKQNRTAAFGFTSVVLDFKLTQGNVDLLFSRHK